MKLHTVEGGVLIDLGKNTREEELGELAAAAGVIAAIRRSQGHEGAARSWEKAGDVYNAQLAREERQSPIQRARK